MLEKINFKKGNGLVPAIVQDARTLKVLMLGYMSEKALLQTRQLGKVTFFSRSKNRLWTKGETSGNFLEFVSYEVDCDGDTLLIRANPAGPTCHTGSDTCFNESNNKPFDLTTLAQIIQGRKTASPDSSYTASLLSRGVNKIAQKVGEEAVELIIEAKDENPELFMGEAADLLYHVLVLFTYKNITLEEVLKVLEQRHNS